MGAYLSEPITEKETEEGVLHGSIHFGASAMQGWRRGMEDEHIAVDLQAPAGAAGTNVAMFGVWDGHGGQEVAKFVKVHMAAEIVKTEEYQRGDYGAALVKVFHRMDEMLWDKANLKELDSYKKGASEAPASDATARAEDGPLALRPGSDAADAEEDEDGSAKMSKAEVLDMFKMLMTAKSAKLAVKAESEAEGGGGGGESGAVPARAAVVGGPVAERAAKAPPQMCMLPPVHVTAGCTSVVAVIAGDTLVVANAGDSRAVLCRRGRAVALSEDHKPSQPVNESALTHAPRHPRPAHSCPLGNGGAWRMRTSPLTSKRRRAGREQMFAWLPASHAVHPQRTPVSRCLQGELARIEAVGGFVNDAGRVNGNLNLSRSIGDLKYKQSKEAPPSAQMITAEPDVRTFTITPGPDEFMVPSRHRCTTITGHKHFCRNVALCPHSSAPCRQCSV